MRSALRFLQTRWRTSQSPSRSKKFKDGGSKMASTSARLVDFPPWKYCNDLYDSGLYKTQSYLYMTKTVMVLVWMTYLNGNQGYSDLWSQNNCNSVDEESASDNRQWDKPKPEEDVDLFVNDVSWENTKTVMKLNCTGWTILVEGTFCYLWEYNCHWIGSIFEFKSAVFEYSHSIGWKFSIQECVNEKDLSDNIDKVKHFASEESRKTIM